MFGTTVALMLGVAGWLLLRQWWRGELGGPRLRDRLHAWRHRHQAERVYDAAAADGGLANLADPAQAERVTVQRFKGTTAPPGIGRPLMRITPSPDGLHRFTIVEMTQAGRPTGDMACVYCGECVETAGPTCGEDLTFLDWHRQGDDDDAPA